eukprot:5517752-Prymnesium_polylepis.1
MMLLNDGYFGCFRNSSQSVVGPLYSYLFILVTGIMLVNMLIAMMSKVSAVLRTRTPVKAGRSPVAKPAESLPRNAPHAWADLL